MMRDMRYVFAALITLCAVTAVFLAVKISSQENPLSGSIEVASSTTADTSHGLGMIDYPGVGLGEELLLPAGVSIRPTRLLKDSRCSNTTECIGTGDVAVEVVFRPEEEVTGTVSFSTSTLLAGFVIRLLEVYPQKSASDIPIDQYRFVFSVERSQEESVSVEPAGIRGMVLGGPMCPVVREGVPCPDKPMSSVSIKLTNGEGKTVATTKTSSDGSFVLTLSPGVYTLSRDGDNPFPAFTPLVVSVDPGVWREVLVRADTGIR